jgi:periplasmic divalent cation tolerance protein
MEPSEGRPTDARVVLVTAPDRATGEALARELVRRRVAACVNVLDGVTSVYRWRGAVEEAREVLLVAKTTAARYAEFERSLGELHPYEVPECVALAPVAVAAKYFAWLAEETR